MDLAEHGGTVARQARAVTVGPVRLVRVEGDARGRGRTAGTALADLIHQSLAFYRRYMERRGVRAADLPGLLGPYREAAAAAFPHLVAEIEGMAEGAGAPFWELFAVNAWEELEEHVLDVGPTLRPGERCSAFAVRGASGGPILGHNEQWLAGDAGNVAVIVARPDDAVPFASATVACCLPAIGLNAAGMGQAIMSLTAADDRQGIPRVLVSRSSLQATSADDAVTRATTLGRAGGYGFLFATPDESFVVETTAAHHAVLRHRPAHTNHYLDPDLAILAPAPWPGSVARLERLELLLAERHGASPEDAMAVLADHGSEPQAICLHAEPGDPEANRVLFGMVCDVEARRMWVAKGNPCAASFQEIDLGEGFR